MNLISPSWKRMRYRATAQVKIDVVKNNYNYIQSLTHSKIMAVVKADAYGHGAERIAKELSALGCNDFAVACLSEAEHLRNCGINGNILILSPTDESMVSLITEGNFIQTTDSYEYSKALSDHGKIRVHIKVDTGMSRIGIYCHSFEDIPNAANEIERISKLENVSVEGIFTHFADSDSNDSSFTQQQFSVFKALLEELEKRKVNVGTRHCCNSAATLNYPEMHLDMVRAGIILYGLMPSEYCKDKNILPAIKFSARVCAVHQLKKGDCVSYGCTYTAERDTRVAVVSIGYADGFSRVYSGKEIMRINGKRFATVGKICMDLCVVDIGPDFPCKVGDEAVIFENADGIKLLADAMGTINYEILCSLKHRVLLEYI